MTPDDVARVQWAHYKALELPAAEREAFLLEIFPDDPGLRNEVQELLVYAETSGTFLDTPLIGRFIRMDSDESRPARIGPYELVRELGHGGTASVHLARRADDLFTKEVAVKILNRLSHGRDAFRRFASEIQMLAALEHPHIVRLLDAGTTGEAVAYIVTELVEGKHIDEFCRDQPLVAKVRLFVKVCDGVSAAHRRLIVHRDLKPSNILVTPDGTPKLLDFGIAILLSQPERLTMTGFGRMTERYASPEQLRGEKEVSTLTDVYSLGAVFQELAPEAPRDLAAIFSKAASPEAGRRYQSVEQIEEELQRFLDGQPVLARGRDLRYRFSRFTRRHWVAASTGAFALTALIGLSIFSTVEAVQAKHQAEHVKTILLSGFSKAGSNTGDWTSLLQLRTVETTRLSFLDAVAGEYQSDQDLQIQLIGSLRTLGTVQGLPSALNLGNTAEASHDFNRAVRIGEVLVRRFPGAALANNVAVAHVELGSVYLEMGRKEDAETQFSRAQALVESNRDESSFRTRLELLAQRSRIMVLRGQNEAALTLRREIVRQRRELFGKNRESMLWEFAGTLCSYGELLREMAHYREADQAYAEAIPLIEELTGRAPFSFEQLWNLARENQEFARVLLAEGKEAAAFEYLNRAIEVYRGIASREPSAMSNQRALAVCLATLGASLGRRADRSKAQPLLRESYGLSQRAAAEDPASWRAQVEFDEVKRQFAAMAER